MSASTNNQAF
jgi:hypothetical protein